jgi:S-methyl-5-thioribose-1-phosphate isomerase
MEGDTVKMINQPLIPHRFEVIDLKNHNETANAIKTMIVRGAGAIGAAGGYGIIQAALQAPDSGFIDYVNKAAGVLKNTRPTAQNLFYAINRVMDKIKENQNDPAKAREEAFKEAQSIADEDASACEKIGEFGAELIKDGYRILTHCNAGWLAFVDWGSALSPIFKAKRQGKKLFVFADETRPRCQGARLTAWELVNEGIDHAIIADNAAGHYMKNGSIDMVIVGSDRIVARDGSVANKIGTYEKAVLAKENGIPFYVAAPTSTIDFELESGDAIPIEERDEEEVLKMFGLSERGEVEEVRIAPEAGRAMNPAFDVTPAEFIRGIITEKGILKPTEMMGLKP